MKGVASFLLLTGLSGCLVAHCHAGDEDRTRAFLRTLDVAAYERNGTDYTNPKFSPLRLGKPFEKIDQTFDYDFPRLAATEKRLQGVDRRVVLKHLFDHLCRGAASDTDRHLRVLKFVHKVGRHGYIAAMHPDKQMVVDPLLLLELNEMRCGQVSRLALDLFGAAGYRGRVVQAGAHQFAEVFYDGKWHYLDGDLFGNGQSVISADGTVPAVAELSRTHFAIDAVPAYWEPDYKNEFVPYSPDYPSYYYFSKKSYTSPALLYVKTATPQQERESKYYGWNYSQTVPDPDRRLVADLAKKTCAGAPFLQDARTEKGPDGTLVARVSWTPSQDGDGDLLGYRLYVGRKSRGWCYNSGGLDKKIAHLKSHGPRGAWEPAMYERRFSLPPSDVALMTTKEPTVTVRLKPPAAGGRYYLTVMPYDAHGEKVGRKFYPMSEEIVIPH
jgi:hypothetical protein